MQRFARLSCALEHIFQVEEQATVAKVIAAGEKPSTRCRHWAVAARRTYSRYAVVVSPVSSESQNNATSVNRTPAASPHPILLDARQFNGLPRQEATVAPTLW